MTFGNSWNRAWSNTWSMIASAAGKHTIDQIPQELFDDALALCFWTVVTDHCKGKLPPHVLDSCTPPPEPTRGWDRLLSDLRSLP